MFTTLILLLVLMILGAFIALESRDLLSGIISLGIIGFDFGYGIERNRWEPHFQLGVLPF